MNTRCETILRTLHAKNGYTFFDSSEPYDLGLFGVRRAQDVNTFNDILGCTFRDDKNGPLNVELWRGTTDPGLTYLKNPIHNSGTSIVVPQQARGCWQVGLHRGKYRALVQRGPMMIALDANRDSVLDLSARRVMGDNFGINCHHAGVSSKQVDRWSAGCQVHARIATFDRMMSLVDHSLAAHPTWLKFSYTLFDVAKNPEALELFDFLAA